MNQLTPDQIKTLEDAFANYPEDFSGISKYDSMEGIQEQLDELNNEPGKIFYVTNVRGTPSHRGFTIEIMKVGEVKWKELYHQDLEKYSMTLNLG